MTDPETRYPTLEKMALAVITSARKLRPYFQSPMIEVLMNQPLRTIIQNTNQSGRLSKWAIELSEHDIVFKNWTVAKSQVLADFLIELAPELEQDLILPSQNWILHVDGSRSALVSPLRTTKQSTSRSSQDYDLLRRSRQNGSVRTATRNSSLVSSAATTTPATSEWTPTLKSSKHSLRTLSSSNSPKSQEGGNVCADALFALGSRLRHRVKRTIPIHKIDKPIIELTSEGTTIVAPISEAVAMEDDSATEQIETSDWRTDFIDYLVDGKLPPREVNCETTQNMKCSLRRFGWRAPLMDRN
ncbi:hypothetical protein Bca4012_072880 [Brassica carinata]